MTYIGGRSGSREMRKNTGKEKGKAIFFFKKRNHMFL